MRINRAIKQVMKENGVTQRRMAIAIGKSKPNDISARLMSKNMSFDKAIEMLNVMGYEVVVQPVTKGQRKEGTIVIDGKDDTVDGEKQ